MNGPSALVYSNCDTSLEDAEASFSNNRINGVISPIIFVDCIVRYGGGQLFPGQPVILQRSILKFTIPSLLPTEPAKMAMRTLTGADLNRDRVNLVL
jgi:hypothetical protein